VDKLKYRSEAYCIRDVLPIPLSPTMTSLRLLMISSSLLPGLLSVRPRKKSSSAALARVGACESRELLGRKRIEGAVDLEEFGAVVSGAGLWWTVRGRAKCLPYQTL
jgi:hypothetical protein